MTEVYAILTIAYRDVLKFLRDVPRLASTFVFPFIFIGIVGGSFQQNLGETLGFNFLVFTFTGVFAQTLFQSSAMGVVSLIDDRENDFSQEMFVSPISRYSYPGEISASRWWRWQGLGIIVSSHHRRLSDRHPARRSP